MTTVPRRLLDHDRPHLRPILRIQIQLSRLDHRPIHHRRLVTFIPEHRYLLLLNHQNPPLHPSHLDRLDLRPRQEKHRDLPLLRPDRQSRRNMMIMLKRNEPLGLRIRRNMMIMRKRNVYQGLLNHQTSMMTKQKLSDVIPSRLNRQSTTIMPKLKGDQCRGTSHPLPSDPPVVFRRFLNRWKSTIWRKLSQDLDQDPDHRQVLAHLLRVNRVHVLVLDHRVSRHLRLETDPNQDQDLRMLMSLEHVRDQNPALRKPDRDPGQ